MKQNNSLKPHMDDLHKNKKVFGGIEIGINRYLKDVNIEIKESDIITKCNKELKMRPLSLVLYYYDRNRKLGFYMNGRRGFDVPRMVGKCNLEQGHNGRHLIKNPKLIVRKILYL